MARLPEQFMNMKTISEAIDHLEETLIALFLGLMTLITFANVIARYVFNANILWALEASVFLFAWMVLLGVSYGVKKNFHIGVDIIVTSVSKPLSTALTVLALLCCIVFAGIILFGAMEYWLPFIGKRAFLETNDIPMPGFLQFLADWLNEGETYEKMPRFIPYFALPLGMALLLFRFIEAGWNIMTGKQTRLIASHEAESLIDDVHPKISGEK